MTNEIGAVHCDLVAPVTSSLARRMVNPARHLIGVKKMLIWPLRHPKPFDPADHDRRQQAHDELAARVLGNTDQKD